MFSRGRWVLLKAIEDHGSINKAAREVGISYRRAWGYLRAMEERLGISLIETQVGGKEGGGTRLTEEARLLMDRYQALELGMNEIVDQRFKEIFGSGEEDKFFSQALCKSDISLKEK